LTRSSGASSGVETRRRLIETSTTSAFLFDGARFGTVGEPEGGRLRVPGGAAGELRKEPTRGLSIPSPALQSARGARHFFVAVPRISRRGGHQLQVVPDHSDNFVAFQAGANFRAISPPLRSPYRRIRGGRLRERPCEGEGKKHGIFPGRLHGSSGPRDGFVVINLRVGKKRKAGGRKRLLDTSTRLKIAKTGLVCPATALPRFSALVKRAPSAFFPFLRGTRGEAQSARPVKNRKVRLAEAWLLSRFGKSRVIGVFFLHFGEQTLRDDALEQFSRHDLLRTPTRPKGTRVLRRG